MSVLFLCGQKCCGKTYYLNKLKNLVSAQFFDLDDEILEFYNSQSALQYGSVREIYKKIGEKVFRELEHSAFMNFVPKLCNNSIIALGGGSVNLLDTCNKVGTTVYLYQNPKVLFQRMEQLGLPPFISDYSSFLELFSKRNICYMKKCSIVIDLFQTEEQQVCQILLETFSS